jgi:hypothetical protein
MPTVCLLEGSVTAAATAPPEVRSKTMLDVGRRQCQRGVRITDHGPH